MVVLNILVLVYLSNVIPSRDCEMLDEYDPDQDPLTDWHLVWIPWWQHPQSQSALQTQRLNSPSTWTHITRCSTIRVFFLATHTDILKHTYFKWKEVWFHKDSSFPQPPTVLFHWPHWQQSKMVIVLVGWKQHGLLPLLESIFCMRPTVRFAVKMSQ